MKLFELKEFICGLPQELDNFTVVNGEYGLLDPNDEDSMVYRVDKPVLVISVDENDQEIVLLHQTREDLRADVDVYGNPKGTE
jgi:hypothetical protein